MFSLVNSESPINFGPLTWTPDRILIVVIHALHLRHLQPNALSTICSQQLIFGVAECERSFRFSSAGLSLGRSEIETLGYMFLLT
jgi:hypothetical protein